MRAFQITCVVFAVITLSVQSIRHFYVKYFESTISVLEKYEHQDIQQKIEQAASLKELVAEYEPTRKRTDELDKLKKGKTEEEVKQFEEQYRDEYRQESELHSAIRDWERKSQDIRELQIFWGCGCGLFLIGLGMYWKINRWVGMAFLAAGGTEMIWWTSPSIGWGHRIVEYERLLNNKMFFTNLSLILIIVTWLVYDHHYRTIQNAILKKDMIKIEA